MQKRSSKLDFAQNALRVVEISTGEPLKPKEAEPKRAAEKNPAAVALGRLGGLVGGKKRAATLSDSRKREIASNAARTRWDAKKATTQ